MNAKIYIVDVDNTICKTNGENYKTAKPYKRRIAKMNKLYEQGHIIIYQTARGQRTGENWMDFTRKQLEEWGCKFYTIKAKNYADFIIDDKAVNSEDFFNKGLKVIIH